MKYKWCLKKYWWNWAKYDLQLMYYKVFYNFNRGDQGMMLPKTGKGKFVSVYSKGKIIQIIDERGKSDEIRIIPYQPNHGIMVEQWKNGKLCCRNLLDIEQLQKSVIFASNVEQLIKK